MLKFLVLQFSTQFELKERAYVITESVSLTQGNTFCLLIYVPNIRFEQGLFILKCSYFPVTVLLYFSVVV
jgi:hypothetical protein